MQGNAKIIFETILKGYLSCEKNDPLYLQEEEIYLLKRYKDFQFSIIKEWTFSKRQIWKKNVEHSNFVRGGTGSAILV